MNIDLIDQSIEDNHKSAFIIIHSFFSFVDILLIIIILYMARYYIYPFKQLLYVMILSIINRIINILSYSFKISFLKELFLTLITCSQFFFILSFINHVFIGSESIYLKYLKDISNFESKFFSLLFLFLVFPSEKFFFTYSNVFYIFKSFFVFICLYFFYKYMKKKFKYFVEHYSDKIRQKIFLYSIFINLPGLAFYSFCGKILLILFKLLFKDKLYISYLEMALITFNESGKYAIYIILLGLSYILSSSTTTITTVKTVSDINEVTVYQN